MKVELTCNIIGIAIFILFFACVGFIMVFKNKVFTDWFENYAHKHGYDKHGISGHKFNRIMFFLEGVFALFMSLGLLTVIILGILGIVEFQ